MYLGGYVIFALSMYPPYPWVAAVLLTLVLLLAPVLIALYRAGRNTHWHTLSLLTGAVVLGISFIRFRAAVHKITCLTYLWDRDLWGGYSEPTLVMPSSVSLYSHCVSIDYPSFVLILVDFLVYAGLPALFFAAIIGVAFKICGIYASLMPK